MTDSTSDASWPETPGGEKDAMEEKAGQDDVVRLTGTWEDDGVYTVRTVLTPDDDRRPKEILCDTRPAIPVIFVPGVMGTLLVNKDDGSSLWSPPNLDGAWSGLAGVIAVVIGWFAGAASRQKRYDPTVAMVNPGGPINVGGSRLSEAEARRRGWGALHRWSYHTALAWLEEQLNNAICDNKPCGEWQHGDPEGRKAALKPVLGTHPSEYGGYGHGEALDADGAAFKHFTRFRYPVYAIGYNWLQSNLDSARDVLDGFDFFDHETESITRVMGIKEICKENHTDKAIVITHSMGSLVIRMASQLLDGAGHLYGVVHGAQPATGAPLAAKRFRTGGEDFINDSLMGANAAEFVAVTAHAQGPLELTPMPDYHNGAPWWIFVDRTGKERLKFPKRSALNELYINPAWYGLLPDRSILDPAGIVKKEMEKNDVNVDVEKDFEERMRVVVERQGAMVNNYHPNTYALYGDGALKESEGSSNQEFSEPEKNLMAWGNVVWQGDITKYSEEDLLAAKLYADDNNGRISIIVRGEIVTLSVQKTAVRASNGMDNGIITGDGTVPVWSAEAQARGLKPDVPGSKAKGVQMVFAQGGYAHQFCYDHPWARWATLYSVVQIAQSIPEPA